MKKSKTILLLFVFAAISCKLSKPITPAEEEKERRHVITLIAASDNLFHETIIRTHKQDEIYNFIPIYSEIKTLVEKADLAFINQETVMAGEDYGYTGFPSFNTPQELAKDLSIIGFDIVNQANNHAMDMGKDGLIATLELWDTIDGIKVIGARKSGDHHCIITKNNISLGFLSYTYGLNGNALPKDNPNLVSLINRSKMEEEIKALRPLCDFLIVSMHWGEEYQMKPSANQESLALFLAELNTDLIIGHHPHVLQKAQKLPRPDGKETLCFYSLGNFVSHQREKERLLGAMMFVTFYKEGNKLEISDNGLIPVVCHFEQNYTNTKVYPLYSYSQELLEKHWMRRIDKGMTFDFFNSVLKGLETKIYAQDPL